MVFLYTGVFGIWSFLERIGADAGLSPQFAGTVVSGALFAGAVAALVPVWLGDRLGRRGPILLASLMLLIAIAVLGSNVTKLSFAAAALTFNAAWTIAIIFQLGAVAAADTTGRFVTGIPAATALGATLGPALGGITKAQLGITGLCAVAMASVLASLAIATWVSGESRWGCTGGHRGMMCYRS